MNHFGGLSLRIFFATLILMGLVACGGGGGGGTGSNDNDTTGMVDQAFTLPNQGLSGSVNTVIEASDGSGDIYVGGSFTSYNSTASNRIIRFNSDGTVDSAFAVGTGFDNAVLTLIPASDGSGDLYVGGNFTSYNGTASSRIARLNSDGSVDTAFVVGAGFDGYVTTLVLASDGSGDIYVGGSFTSYNGTASNYIIRLNSDGSVDSAFTVGTGFDVDVTTLAPATDGSGDLYVGGWFSSYNGTASSRIARLNSDGSVDTAFVVGAGFDGYVYVTTLVLASDGSGDIYVGGSFTSYNGTASNYIIRLNSDGSVDSAFTVGTGFDVDVTTLAPATDGSGDLYVGGGFTSYNGTASRRIIRLNSDGTVDSAFAVGTGFDDAVLTLISASDGSGDLYVGGRFGSYNGTASTGIIRLNSDGSLGSAFAVSTGFNAEVNTLAPVTDGSGDLYVGGGFTSYNGTASNHIIRLNSDGSVDNAFAVGTGFLGTVQTIAPANDGSGDLYVGGSLVSYNGTFISEIIRLNSDGSMDNTFAVGGISGTVYTLIPATDGSGDLYVGGQFTGSGGVNNLIRLNSDGSVDSAFAVGTGCNNAVLTLVPASDGSGDLYVGGRFTSYNGTASNRIIRLNSDGSVDSAFAVGTGFGSIVNTMVPAPDGSGDLYVGGQFGSYNGTASNYIIRLNSDGSVDSAFTVGTGFNLYVHTLAQVSDGSGDLYVGGSFTSYNGTASNRIIRLNSDGSVDSAFAVGTGFNNAVLTLVPASDGLGNIYAGGFFTAYQNTTTMNVIALSPDGSID